MIQAKHVESAAELAKTIAACFCKGRKVRAPMGRVPDNVWAARADDKCSREDTA